MEETMHVALINPSYRPLSGTEARFIKLQPGSWTDPIKCDLLCLPITDPPQFKFIGLSYFWGTMQDSEQILLDNHPVQVTKNLFAALRQLRDFLRDPLYAPDAFSNPDILFWIDALCINQSDVEEKSLQVPRMDEIYCSADPVVAWLGEDAPEDKKMINKIMGMPALIDTEMDHERFVSEHLDPLSKIELDHFFRAFIRLLDRDWFNRVWVVQEVVMANNDPIALSGQNWCTIDGLGSVWWMIYESRYYHAARRLKTGRRLLTFNTLRRIIREQRTPESSDAETASDEDPKSEKSGQEHSNEEVIESLTNAFELSSIAAAVEDEGTEDLELVKLRASTSMLSRIMHQLSGPLEATLPHDYMYGILAMASPLGCPEVLAPKYSLPFQDVFHAYARAILEHTGDLSILPRREGHELPGAPTWVPDFRLPRADAALAPKTKARVKISDDGKVCITEGVYLGHVRLTSDYDGDTYRGFRQTLLKLDKLLDDICQHEKSEEINKAALLRACLGRWFAGKKSHIPRTSVRTFYDSVIASQILPTEDQYTRGIVDIFMSKLRGYQIFWTSRGAMGRLTNETRRLQEGDILVLTRGTGLPFLLRPTVVEGEYTFIGNFRFLYGGSDVERSEEYFAKSEMRTFHLV